MESPTSDSATPAGAADPAAGDFSVPAVPAPLPPLPDLPTLRSPDGRLELTATTLRVQGQTLGLLELEAAELTPVRWLLWYLLGLLTLAGFALGFLQNWLRTLPAAAGMAAGRPAAGLRAARHQPPAPAPAGARGPAFCPARRSRRLAAAGAGAEPPHPPAPRLRRRPGRAALRRAADRCARFWVRSVGDTLLFWSRPGGQLG